MKLMRRLGLVILAAVVLGTATAASATAAPVSMVFDHGRLSMGALLRDQHVLPAADRFPSDSLPLPQRTDVELTGTETDGVLSFPEALNPGTKFPYMGMDHPAEAGLKIPVTFRLNPPGLTGTYDRQTGAVRLEGSIDIVVITGQGASFPLPDGLVDSAVPPLGLLARCRIPDLPVSLSTENELPYRGSPFASGLSGDGAIAMMWNTVPAAVSENGGDCDTLNVITAGYGGLWLSHGLSEAPFARRPAPTCSEDPAVCPKPDPEPSGSANITGIRFVPAKRFLRPGRKATLRLRVTNSGDAPARVAVRLRKSSRGVVVRRRASLLVPAGSHATLRLKVRARRSASGTAVVSATAAGHRSAAVLKIRSSSR
jgi:hypothetical protein